MRFPSRVPTSSSGQLQPQADPFRSRHTLVAGMAGSLAAVRELEDWHHTECLEGHDPPSWFSARLKRPMMADKAAFRVHNVFARVMSAREELGHKTRILVDQVGETLSA
ncbi:hypothetical protein B0T18DRAFT_40766 [Schizothecium vesticola]|uniref:Uncharacterized protein n=1 Tax=Schizothecium vesticola TaxID=314040 RepID=A0AA40FBF8_9PEZI|nr:hypothetical protein B0T18DRAFT_40766 [Schizothecium vesticola]